MMKRLSSRTLLAVTHDLAASFVAWFFAYQLRFNFEVPAEFTRYMWATVVWVLPINASVFWCFGVYRGVWRFASIPDLKRILSAVAVATLIVTAALLILRLPVVVPRSVLVLDPLLLVLMMGGGRLLYRAWKEHGLLGIARMQGRPVLVLGSGHAAIALLKELGRSREWCVVGLLDDKRELHGRQLYGAKVLGSIDQLPLFASRLGVEHAIVAMPSVARIARRRAVEIADRAGLKIFTVPSFDDLMNGNVNISQIRPIEVEDLLGREPVHLDNSGLTDLLAGRVVMVTGAGGSIGSELCRQIAKFKPSLLVCLEISEHALYQLEQEFLANFPETRMVYLIGNVKNESRIQCVLEKYRPLILFHAAAYKHVPMMENDNVSEALQNNVLGTEVLARLSQLHGVEKFVLISTDKAVNPTNVMGASKRLAEMVCQGIQAASGTRFIVVRFGNVLGSSGSVIPKFREQIAKGGPVTVTHPDITRYFMSIPEATQLVMQAACMGKGGEIFVLDMGESVRIDDLARDMIRLSGIPEGEVEIVYTGLRPGEKVYEELLADDEHTLPTPHAKLRIASARAVDYLWVRSLNDWIHSVTGSDDPTTKEQLKQWVEEYSFNTLRQADRVSTNHNQTTSMNSYRESHGATR